MPKVKVTIRNVYGKQLIYPVNDDAQKFTKLLGKKTIDQSELEVIKSLGFEIELVNSYTLELNKGNE